MLHQLSGLPRPEVGICPKSTHFGGEIVYYTDHMVTKNVDVSRIRFKSVRQKDILTILVIFFV